MAQKEAPLMSVDDKTLHQWRDVICETSKTHRLFVASDTETTCSEKLSPSGLFNRVVEWSMVVCKENEDHTLSILHDKKGRPIFIDEPINFLATDPACPKLMKSVTRISREVVAVHGITPAYLLGEEEGTKGRGKLSCEAPNFRAVMTAVKSLFSEVTYSNPAQAPVMMFYNAIFDIGFLELEAELWEMPNVQSYFAVVDPLSLVRKHCSFLKKKTLDAAYEWAKEQCPEVEPIERPYHSALIDSTMMITVYNAVVKQLREIPVSDAG